MMKANQELNQLFSSQDDDVVVHIAVSSTRKVLEKRRCFNTEKSHDAKIQHTRKISRLMGIINNVNKRFV